VDVELPNDDQLRNAWLKKKKVYTRSSLRPRTWLDHKQKGAEYRQQERYIVNSYAIFLVSSSVAFMDTSDDLQAQVVEDNTRRDNMRDFNQFGIINSFTQLLMIIL
jgi:hypothetical protein